MERRSIVLSALIIAIGATAILFYNFGAVAPERLAARLGAGDDGTQQEQAVPTEEAMVEEAPTVAQDEAVPMNEAMEATDEAVAAEETVPVRLAQAASDETADGASAVTPTPAPVEAEVLGAADQAADPATAGAQDVAPTAETGAGGLAIVLAGLALVMGMSGLVFTFKQA